MRMRAAGQGEFRVTGKDREGQWRVFVGAGVSAPAEVAVRDLLLRPRFGILHAAQREANGPYPALLDELVARGYDPLSVRVSLSLLGHGVPRKPRVLGGIEGAVVVRWGWLDYDHSPDIAGAWRSPATSRDLNLVFSALSSPSTPALESTSTYVRLKSPREQLAEMGWDWRTFNFVARRAPTAPVSD